MGFFLFLFGSAAALAGLALSALLGAIALMVVLRNSTRRDGVWKAAGPGFVIGWFAVLIAIRLLPLQAAPAGSGYEQTAAAWIGLGFAYGLSPGLAALVGAACTWLRPRLADGAGGSAPPRVHD